MTANEISVNKGPDIGEQGGFQRLESLYTCLNAIRSWFDIFFSIPAAEYIAFPLTIWSQFTRALLTAYLLTSLEDPGWNKDQVRNTVDLIQVAEQLSFNAGQAAALSSMNTSDTDEDFYTMLAKKLKMLAEGWTARLGFTSTGTSAGLNKQAADESAIDFLSVELFEGWLNESLLL